MMIKRVIGLPGDRVAIRGGRLVLNGRKVPRVFVSEYRYREHNGPIVTVRQYREQIASGAAYTIIEQSDERFGDNTRVFDVPSGHLFMLGDNRDNSADSRYRHLGFVPVDNLVGRAEKILFSLKSCDSEPGLVCPGRRLLSAIE